MVSFLTGWEKKNSDLKKKKSFSIDNKKKNKKGLQKLVCTAVMQRGAPPASELRDYKAPPPHSSRDATSHGRERREGGFKAVAGEQRRPSPFTTALHVSRQPVPASQTGLLPRPIEPSASGSRHIPVKIDTFEVFSPCFQLKSDLTSFLKHIQYDISRWYET